VLSSGEPGSVSFRSKPVPILAGGQIAIWGTMATKSKESLARKSSTVVYDLSANGFLHLNRRLPESTVYERHFLTQSKRDKVLVYVDAQFFRPLRPKYSRGENPNPFG
jgi:hypothetical protein